MTEQELKDQWTRFMHRNDLAADLDEIYGYAAQLVYERLISITAPSIDDIVANSPRPMPHAGLIYLHELAQDDNGMMREMDRFESAIQDYALRTSINNVDPQMTRPYYPEATNAD